MDTIKLDNKQIKVHETKHLCLDVRVSDFTGNCQEVLNGSIVFRIRNREESNKSLQHYKLISSHSPKNISNRI